MRALTSSVFAALAVTLVAWALTYAVAPPQLSQATYFSLNPQAYRVEPFIRMVVELQSLDRSAALAKLHAMTRDPQGAARVIVLSRMLFTRPGSGLRRPMIGGSIFLGGTAYADWPQDPVEVVDGVPFLIARGYVLAGPAETSESYLQYCETHGDWSVAHYSLKTTQEKRYALNMLLASPKWKIPLNDSERKFLTDQIE